MSEDLSAFLGSLRAGPVVSSGHFTIDSARVGSRFASLLALEPALPLLKWVQAAVVLRAPGVSVRLWLDTLEVSFKASQGDHGLVADVREALTTGVIPNSANPRAIQHLLVALQMGCSLPGLASLRVRLLDTDLFFGPETSVKAAVDTDDWHPGMDSIVLLIRLTPTPWWRLSGSHAQLLAAVSQSLSQRCAWAPIPVTLEGRSLNWGWLQDAPGSVYSQRTRNTTRWSRDGAIGCSSLAHFIDLWWLRRAEGAECFLRPDLAQCRAKAIELSSGGGLDFPPIGAAEVPPSSTATLQMACLRLAEDSLHLCEPQSHLECVDGGEVLVLPPALTGRLKSLVGGDDWGGHGVTRAEVRTDVFWGEKGQYACYSIEPRCADKLRMVEPQPPAGRNWRPLRFGIPAQPPIEVGGQLFRFGGATPDVVLEAPEAAAAAAFVGRCPQRARPIDLVTGKVFIRQLRYQPMLVERSLGLLADPRDRSYLFCVMDGITTNPLEVELELPGLVAVVADSSLDTDLGGFTLIDNDKLKDCLAGFAGHRELILKRLEGWLNSSDSYDSILYPWCRQALATYFRGINAAC